MEKQNRADRRKNRFGGGRSTERGGWPSVQPNPVFSDDGPAGEAQPEPAADAEPIVEAETAKADEVDPAKP